ncbi:MAG TPA: hypothetical protein ENH63_18875 [Sulfitobacter litoralis]|uniref:Uncharacterized protein n=1 Tax=Sulfitobacter litoralis TaxID=335975 RepID=A0A7V1A6L4_9RHOB|nr:hypothetical protein [Sulfitobacter litoralis]HDY95472.1 hypothetical protein [Sulfitobacter litoralis]HDZ53794.1 hypothetical protein [Sulfitobacter litoralis]
MRQVHRVDLDDGFGATACRGKGNLSLDELAGRQVGIVLQQGFKELGGGVLRWASPVWWEKLYWPFWAERRQANTI